MRIEGVYVAVVTPFSASGELDLDELKRHLNWLADSGVDGFVPCGTTGEGPTLKAEERTKILKVTRELATKRGKRLIAGCGGNSTESVIGLVGEAADLGADAALVVTPYYNKPTQKGLLAHYRMVADRSQIPIVLYNVPGRTGVSLGVETIASLFEHPNIVGIKEASGQWAQWLGIAQTGMLKDNSLLAGDDDAFAPILSLGGTGIISASANVAPRRFVSLYQAHRNGDPAAAYAAQVRLNPLVKTLFAETNPSPVKAALKILGFGTGKVRLPLVEASDSLAKQVETALKELELLA